jgi:hypothetical protein
MSAMNSNDTISYLCVAISIYLTIVALEHRLAPLRLALLSIVLTVTVFTKYTAFAIQRAGRVVVGLSRPACCLAKTTLVVNPRCARPALVDSGRLRGGQRKALPYSVAVERLAL